MQKSDFVVWKKSFQLSRKNRDRVGGHKCNLDHEWSKCYRKKLRRQHIEQIALGMAEYNQAIWDEQGAWDEAYSLEEFIEDESWDDPYDPYGPYGYSKYEGEEKDDFKDYDDSSSFNVYPEDLDTFMDRFDDFLKS